MEIDLTRSTGTTDRDDDSAYYSNPSQLSSDPYDTAIEKSPSSQQTYQHALTRGFEHGPKHKWTSMQRHVLAILWRYYDRSDMGSFTHLFNSITGLQLRSNKLPAQFGNGGRRMAKIKEAVYKVEFHDPEGLFDELHLIIEQHASKVGVEVQLKKVEDVPSSKRSQADIHISVSSETSLSGLDDPWASSNNHTIPIGSPDTSDTAPRAKKSPLILKPLAWMEYEQPHLAFRVWDGNSWTAFKKGHLTSKLFSDRNAGVTQPLAPDDPSGLFEPLCLAHMSFKGGASPFVSVVTSLVQLLKYAGTKEADAMIAVIDLSHEGLEVKNKKHHAKDIIKRLRSSGEMNWSKYRGECEYLIWGDIPQAAIMHTFLATDLYQLADWSKDVAELLRLHLFDGHSRTRSIAQQLRQQQKRLDVHSAAAIGAIALSFGLNKESVSLDHLSHFVTAFLDGGWIRSGHLNDEAQLESAAAFAKSLGSDLLERDVVCAFLGGLERGKA
ncbi:hypothetical protein BDV96DRAFT_294195 [Lophiotrema nucula]|uniref:DUF7587 domain-containing protein n=1 Tax=Lophiotrema nucula TaxID=690887 RepID=A0A6A5YNM1_9PLEO|nr:hypothetical protein BDV96DRAFT_294195 [Lophiotrema nucula]